VNLSKWPWALIFLCVSRIEALPVSAGICRLALHGPEVRQVLNMRGKNNMAYEIPRSENGVTPLYDKGFTISPEGRTTYYLIPVPAAILPSVEAEMTNFYNSRPKVDYHPRPPAVEEAHEGTPKISTHPLVTTALTMCSSVAFHFQGKNFQLHVDGRKDQRQRLHDEIATNFDLKAMREDPNLHIDVHGGKWDTYDSLRTIRNVMDALGLGDKIHYGEPVEAETYVGISREGSFKIEPSEIKRGPQ
jgi:hypothetical protein